MPESPTASRQVMLLILIIGLFAAVWSGDGAHRATGKSERPAASRSAVAILMQTSAAAQRNEQQRAEEAGRERGIELEPTFSNVRPLLIAWLAAVSCEADAADCAVLLDQAVSAPQPSVGRLPAATTQFPVAAPVPAAEDISATDTIAVAAGPVAAPVPAFAADGWDDRSERTASLDAVSSRVKIDYRMTCHCCREYCDGAARRMAAVGRRTGQSFGRLAEMLVQAIEEVDWSARLAAEPGDGSKKRF